MKKECIPIMGFRHSHIGINFTLDVLTFIFLPTNNG